MQCWSLSPGPGLVLFFYYFNDECMHISQFLYTEGFLTSTRFNQLENLFCWV